MLFQLRPGPPNLAALRGPSEPRFNRPGSFLWVERKNEIAETKHTARSHHGSDPRERDAFPEIRDLVQRVPRVNEVGTLTLVVVTKKARLDALNVLQLPTLDF